MKACVDVTCDTMWLYVTENDHWHSNPPAAARGPEPWALGALCLGAPSSEVKTFLEINLKNYKNLAAVI